MNQPIPYIHPDAQVHPGAKIEPFAFIEGNVVIGDGCWIGPHACIMDGARLGKNIKVFPGAVVSGIPQDLKFDGEVTTTEIGDNTTIRECVTISRGTKDKFKTVIGENTLIMAYVHVAHDCVIGNHVILGNTVQVAGHVVIDDWAIVSGASAIHQFVSVGAHSMISGGSLVRKDVPPFIKAAREPLSYAGINSIGLRRRGYTNEQIDEIHNMFRILYQQGLPFSKAVEQIESEIPESEAKTEVIDFLKKSTRGIIKGFDIEIKDSDFSL
jgi:UDP-N-acetylglucosamine acyltransferase